MWVWEKEEWRFPVLAEAAGRTGLSLGSWEVQGERLSLAAAGFWLPLSGPFTRQPRHYISSVTCDLSSGRRSAGSCQHIDNIQSHRLAEITKGVCPRRGSDQAGQMQPTGQVRWGRKIDLTDQVMGSEDPIRFGTRMIWMKRVLGRMQEEELR